MIEMIAMKTVDRLIFEKVLEEEKKNAYQYAMMMLLEKVIASVSILIIAYLKRILIPGVLFMFFFFLLRKRTGGFHASTFFKCYVLSILNFYLLTTVDTYSTQNITIFRIITLVAVIVIMVIGTVNHPNMQLNKEELMQSKKSARYTVLVEAVGLIMLKCVHIDTLCSVYMSFAIIVCAVLLILAKLIKQEV